jgi:hypothetical protein
MGKLIIALMVVSTLLAGLLGLAQAQTGSGYDLSWHTVDGGGTSSVTGGAYTLGGTIGQPDAAVQRGGVYELQGGLPAPGGAGLLSAWSQSLPSSFLGH